MDKAGEAMLEGMVMLAAIVALVAGGAVWLVRRARRKRRAASPEGAPSQGE